MVLRPASKAVYCGIKCRREAFAHGGERASMMSGENNWKWKGGKCHTWDGYVHQRMTDHPRSDTRGYVPEHIAIAEKALGKFLPQGAEVHHFDFNRSNNANTNLVICQDHAYHHHLHRRQRVKQFGGNPDTDKICYRCKKCCDMTENFHRLSRSPDGHTNICRECCKDVKKELKDKVAA